MRVLQVTHQYLPDFTGGVELYTQALSDQLAQRGHQLAIFTRRNQAGDGVSPSPKDLPERPPEAMGTPQVYSVWHGNMSDARRFVVTFGDRVILKHFTSVLDHVQPDIVHIQHLMGLPH